MGFASPWIWSSALEDNSQPVLGSRPGTGEPNRRAVGTEFGIVG